MNLLNCKWSCPDINSPNSFGAKRKYDIHTGVDIFAEEGTNVLSPITGTVCQMGIFTGPRSYPFPTPWWEETQYVIIRSGEIAYLLGEIEIDKNIQINQFVGLDQTIGTVKKVLKNDKGNPTSMLHVEMFDMRQITSDQLAPAIWYHDKKQPKGLINPTLFLEFLEKSCV